MRTHHWLACCFAALLTAACLPAQPGGGTAPQAGTTQPATASDDRQLALAHRQLGLGLEQAGDIAGAVDEYLAALAASKWPSTGAGVEETPLEDLARICQRTDPDEQIVRACGQVAGSYRFRTSRLAEFLANRADAQFRLGRLDLALAEYQTLLRIEPNNTRGLFGRGRVKAAQGNHAGALPDFRRAISSDPDNPAPLYAQALSLAALGQDESAIADFDQVLETQDGIDRFPDAYRDRADAQCRTGQADAAVIDYQLWIGQVPERSGKMQQILTDLGFLETEATEDFGADAVTALRAWTQAGCPAGV